MSFAVAPMLAVSDGRVTIGTINVIDGIYIAVDTGGIVIGTFGSMLEAVRSLPQGGGR